MTKQRLELTWFNKDKALIPTEKGKYGYMWVDPRDPRYCETHALNFEGTFTGGGQSEKQDGTQYGERADLPPTTDNLLINGESGDVLETLTRVPELRDKYVGKVKCVYIDPPFNTAQTFANYEDNLEHSVWLTMMRDRLLHLRNLLSDDGSIWVHLDDVENHRMRVLMDEVFGSSNYVVEMVWEKAYAPSNNASGIPMVTDTILVYRKSAAFSRNKLTRSSEMNSRYSNADNSVRGKWRPDNKSARHTKGNRQHPGVYGIQHPITGEMLYPASTSNWRFDQNKMLAIMREWGRYELGEVTEFELDQRRIIEGHDVSLRDDIRPLVIPEWSEKDKEFALERYRQGNWPVFYFADQGFGGIQRKTYLADLEGSVPKNYLSYEEVGHSDSAKREIQDIFMGEVAFATPKPERLLERIIHIATNPGDIVLDVFAGSGTTAAVAHKMGRRWVTCELLEDTFNRFTLPRLTKVINGEDMGGITTTKGARVDDTVDGLPEGLSPEEAQKLTSLLNKALKDQDGLKKSADIKAIKALVKTKNSGDVVNWRGGGGFTVATLAPTCFDYAPETGYTFLTEDATGKTLVNSVAANLGFYLTKNDPHFDGRRGNEHLAVVEGVLTTEKVDDLMAHLPDGHSLLFAATVLSNGIHETIRNYKNGSRAVHVPLDLFPFGENEEN